MKKEGDLFSGSSVMAGVGRVSSASRLITGQRGGECSLPVYTAEAGYDKRRTVIGFFGEINNGA